MPLNFHSDTDGRTLLAWTGPRLLRFHVRTVKRVEMRDDNNPGRYGFSEGEVTSEERHKAREARRKAKRAAKKERVLQTYSFEKVISSASLVRAAMLSKKGVNWKASVQRYMINVMRNTWTLRQKLLKGESVVQGFICFDLMERGKLRHIRSVHFKERVVQRSLCDNALVPVLSRGLTYDNGASIKGKGIHFAMFRCRDHLRQYYRKHGNNRGWILQVDFKGYFDNIEHGPTREMLEKNFTDERLLSLAWGFVDSFGEKSLGIGSQVSQILAVAYCSAVDHYAVEMLGLNLSARYNDDSYFIHESRQYLEYCLAILSKKWEALGIRINWKKTQIIPLRKFTFLKVRFETTDAGKVIMRPCRKSITKQRKKLKAFRKAVDRGEMSIDDVRASYESWRGYNRHMNGYKSIINMDKLYFDLFGLVPSEVRKKRKRRERKCLLM
ncbi:MAG: hypothetical protein IJ896_11005 [Fibrobacter sp.]|nr:hypothetical protein [Fibrobacter sp.]